MSDAVDLDGRHLVGGSFPVIKNDFANEVNQFLATFYEIQYQDASSMTHLYIPKEGVDKSIEDLLQDKTLVTRFEGTSNANVVG